MLKLYEFEWDVRRMGSVNGLFIADEETIKKSIGKSVHFGEILGKHSDIHGTLDEGDLTVKTDDQEFIMKLIDIIGGYTISGYNPLSYLNEEDEEE